MQDKDESVLSDIPQEMIVDDPPTYAATVDKPPPYVMPYELLHEWTQEEKVVFYEPPDPVLNHVLEGTPREEEKADGTIHYYTSDGHEVKAHQRFAKTPCCYQDTYTITEDTKDYDPPNFKVAKLIE